MAVPGSAHYVIATYLPYAPTYLDIHVFTMISNAHNFFFDESFQRQDQGAKID